MWSRVHNNIRYVEYVEVNCDCGAGFCYQYSSEWTKIPIFCFSCKRFRSMKFKYGMRKWQDQK